MGKSEARTHSFVIRVWLEEGAQPPWRGAITHVVSGQRRYFTDLGEVLSFITPYLDGLALGGTNADEES